MLKYLSEKLPFKGVQEAFEFSPYVMTLSFHKFQPGFFPGNCIAFVLKNSHSIQTIIFSKIRLNSLKMRIWLFDVKKNVYLQHGMFIKDQEDLKNAGKATENTILWMYHYEVASMMKCSTRRFQSKVERILRAILYYIFKFAKV